VGFEYSKSGKTEKEQCSLFFFCFFVRIVFLVRVRACVGGWFRTRGSIRGLVRTRIRGSVRTRGSIRGSVRTRGSIRGSVRTRGLVRTQQGACTFNVFVVGFIPEIILLFRIL